MIAAVEPAVSAIPTAGTVSEFVTVALDHALVAAVNGRVDAAGRQPDDPAHHASSESFQQLAMVASNWLVWQG